MSTFWKVIGIVLVTVIFGTFLQRQFKETAVVLSLAVCVMVALLTASFIQPVIAFVEQLQELGNLDQAMIVILLKSVGIGLITEICTAICTDSGHAAIGKVLQILGATVVLWLALPLMEGLLEILQKILEGL